jgi:hypothetical protein
VNNYTSVSSGKWTAGASTSSSTDIRDEPDVVSVGLTCFLPSNLLVLIAALAHITVERFIRQIGPLPQAAKVIIERV